MNLTRADLSEGGPSTRWRAWVAAARPRTLPLALTPVIMATAIASRVGNSPGLVAFLMVLTVALLQILSNLANDLGDSIHGADHEGRVVARRQVQQGGISADDMRLGGFVTASLALLAGVALLIASPLTWGQMALMLGIGLGCIGAAILYTNGPRPYGYLALGDLAVLLFFGFVGVGGGAFVQTGIWLPHVWLPSLAVGAWAVAVLNLNNLRDIEPDRIAGKKTLARALGVDGAKTYTLILVLLPFLAQSAFVYLMGGGRIAYGFLLLLIPVGYLGRAIWIANVPSRQDKLLKPVAMMALLFAILAGGGLMIDYSIMDLPR